MFGGTTRIGDTYAGLNGPVNVKPLNFSGNNDVFVSSNFAK